MGDGKDPLRIMPFSQIRNQRFGPLPPRGPPFLPPRPRGPGPDARRAPPSRGAAEEPPFTNRLPVPPFPPAPLVAGPLPVPLRVPVPLPAEPRGLELLVPSLRLPIGLLAVPLVLRFPVPLGPLLRLPAGRFPDGRFREFGDRIGASSERALPSRLRGEKGRSPDFLARGRRWESIERSPSFRGRPDLCGERDRSRLGPAESGSSTSSGSSSGRMPASSKGSR